MKRPIPTQIITWMHYNVGEDDGEEDDPQFLYALKDTEAGDRQIVWEGGSARGLISVVDFGDPKLYVNGRWRSWGVSTRLDSPIGLDVLGSDPVLSRRFSPQGMKSLQGLPKRLSPDEGRALERLSRGLPPQRLPRRIPRVGEPVDDWFGSVDLDPEKTFELAVRTSRHLWKKIGFPEPPLIQQRLPAAKAGEKVLIPDLLAPGVVGEVKRSLSPNNGPAQVQRYVDRLNRTRSADGPWRGLLIHGEETLSPAVRERLERLGLPIEVWAVLPASVRRWKAVRQYRL